MSTRRAVILGAAAAAAAAVAGSDHSGSEEDDSGSMPPLLQPSDDEGDDTNKASDALLASSSASSSSSAAASSPEPVGWFSFGTAKQRCVPGYGCCLRYALKLGQCCMPRGVALRSLPSFHWLQSRFYPLHADTATLAFLQDCDANFFQRGWVSWWGIRIAFLKPALRRCMAHTDVNGLLRCGQMFLASTEQMRILLQQSIPDSIRGRPGVEWPWSVPQQADQQRRPSRLLDVGAGDGHITAQLAGFFDEVVTTEVAARMVPRLRAQGWTCAHTADLDEGLPIGGDIAQDGFDCVALFNVLDRCSRPRTLLRQIRERMRKPVPHPSGSGELLNTSRLLLSVPLPLDPSVEVGTRWVDPEERILAAGTARACRDFESASLALADFFVEQGFHVETLSRIPYLSQGDTRRPFYVLDCSLWLLSVRQPGEPKPKDDQPAAAAAAAAAGSGAHHEDHAAHAAPSALSATLNDFTSQVD